MSGSGYLTGLFDSWSSKASKASLVTPMPAKATMMSGNMPAAGSSQIRFCSALLLADIWLSPPRGVRSHRL